MRLTRKQSDSLERKDRQGQATNLMILKVSKSKHSSVCTTELLYKKEKGMREDSVVYPVSRPLEEGPTKTNVKPYSGAGRKAPPPPPPSKSTAGVK